MLPESVDGLPELDERFWRTLEAGLSSIGLPLAAPARAAVDAHVRLLVAWNEAINLTALRAPEQIARNHVLDSLIAVPTLRALSQHGSILDIGSGGGFPGLPVASTMPASRAAVVDSIGKKARFLGVASTAVGQALVASGVEQAPRISALGQRAEDLADAPAHREAWDVVLARALGSVAEVAELGLPLTAVRGHVVLWKRDADGGALEREIGDARRVVQACGGGMPRIVSLPAASHVGLDGHCLVVIEKRRPTPDRYPRPPAERRRARIAGPASPRAHRRAPLLS